MKILAYNPGHDGAAVLLEDHHLRFALESEKDDGLRYDVLSPTLFLRSMQIEEPPDVVSLSGFQKRWQGECAADGETTDLARVEAGYFDEGVFGKTDTETMFSGKAIRRFSSSHVRSHIMCSYGLSPFAQGQPCYVLIWEGVIGAMYYVDECVSIRKIADVLSQPGNKYASLYALADPTFSVNSHPWFRIDDAGKLMALAAYGRAGTPTPDQQEIIQTILAADILSPRAAGESLKGKFSGSRYFNIGVETQEFKDLAFRFSWALFDHFYKFAREHIQSGLPLLIGGGCGLNCDWNTRWRECGLFSSVFVPPCANDSGVALGAAIDALHHYTGRAKLDWSVYAGDYFVEDVSTPPGFDCKPLDLPEVCQSLLKGDVIAWVQGRWELGPRALGNRSLLAAPFDIEMRAKLNRIKQREAFRPVAPICLEEDFTLHFEGNGSSPHMLYFQHVKSRHLAAITHVDGSARAQSVNETENLEMCSLLREFRRQSGVAVLCNTSLNFKGHGFVNRLSQLFTLVRERGIDGLVVGNRFWRSRQTAGH
jgi:hydroxymethyl cephem carbamoyltransferase